MNALLVDSSPTVRATEREVLKALGCEEILEAADAREALALAAEAKPALVLLGGDLPRLDGLTLAQQLRKIRDDIKIIMVAEATDRRSVIEAAHAGVDDYVVKPFLEDVLKRRIKKAIPY
jgi:two-component system chemotaxis response regulator CheY